MIPMRSASISSRGVRVVIPAEIEPRQNDLLQHAAYCQRNCIERVLGQFKIKRAIATTVGRLAKP
jgi:hypothetical protein